MMVQSLLAIACICSSLHAGGLSTQLGEAVIENLRIGETYSLGDLANLRLEVLNTCDYKVSLQMDVLRPDSVELKSGAEPIPDASWVTMSMNTFELGVAQKAVSDITIAIPNDPQHLGRKYQFMIWSHTLGDGQGMTLAYGLKSRIIFTLDTARVFPATVSDDTHASVAISLVPEEIRLTAVPVGEHGDRSGSDTITFRITNHGGKSERVLLHSLKVKNSVTSLAEGYEDTPDESYLSFGESELLLAPGETKVVEAYLNFPEATAYLGKKYMFVIRASTSSSSVNAGVYSRLYANLADRK